MKQGLAQVKSGKPVTLTSMEVADMIGKRHDHLMRDIRGYIKILEDSPNLESQEYFIKSTYFNSQNKEQPCYEITKKGCEICANKLQGKKGVLFTAEYVEKFNAMEEAILKNLAEPVVMDSYMISDPIERAKRWIEEEKERQALKAANDEAVKLLEEQQPKVDFANAVAGAKTAILIRQLAKILTQAGVKNCGERRLFESLRENGYLIKKPGADYNNPTQRSLDMGLFTIKTTVIANSASGTVNYTPKVTQKGVQYFTEKYISGELTM